MESNLSGLVPAAGLVPALPPAVTLGLTAAYTTLYALLFFSVYAQLWLVLLYGHKRLSYQTVFLALCLLWAALRTTLFSFYFRDTPRANRLGPLPFWLLYCCPVCLQFFTLTLMNLYFAQVTVVTGWGWAVEWQSSRPHRSNGRPLLPGGVQSEGETSARDEPRLVSTRPTRWAWPQARGSLVSAPSPRAGLRGGQLRGCLWKLGKVKPPARKAWQRWCMCEGRQ